MNYQIEAVGLTDVGRVRERNEDSLLIDPLASLFIIADGMGGHAAGDVASQTAVEAFAASFNETRNVLVAMQAANRAVLERGMSDPAKTGMGTTMTAFTIFNDNLFGAHVGDSRLYLWRRGQLTQITRDHTVAQEMIDSKALTKREAMQHPMSAMLTRSLGSRMHVDADLLDRKLEVDDLLLFCSDGLTSMVSDEELSAILEHDTPLGTLAVELVEAANVRGGLDNVTVGLIRVAADDGSSGL
jgi:serine/threonine protein phosphatase PrpC